MAHPKVTHGVLTTIVRGTNLLFRICFSNSRPTIITITITITTAMCLMTIVDVPPQDNTPLCCVIVVTREHFHRNDLCQRRDCLLHIHRPFASLGFPSSTSSSSSSSRVRMFVMMMMMMIMFMMTTTLSTSSEFDGFLSVDFPTYHGRHNRRKCE